MYFTEYLEQYYYGIIFIFIIDVLKFSFHC